MRRSELIHIVKDGVDKAITKIKTSAALTFYSTTIAYAIFCYDNDKSTDASIKNNNNIFGYKAGKGFMEYNSIEECILDYYSRTNDIDFTRAKYEQIAKANNLYRFDKAYIESKPGHIIDIDDEKKKPDFDVYTVRDTDETPITKTGDLEEARTVASENKGAVITNSRGVTVDAVVKPTKSDSIVSLILKPGAPVICNGINLYYHLKDNKPGRVIDGTYYLYDGKDLGDRYAICTKSEFALGDPSMIMGYIKLSDIQK